MGEKLFLKPVSSVKYIILLDNMIITIVISVLCHIAISSTPEAHVEDPLLLRLSDVISKVEWLLLECKVDWLVLR
jgi:hypothetical protein